jgi:hypothetical protein
VKGYNIFISNIVNNQAMDENRTVMYIALILVITLLVFPKLIAVSNIASKFFAQAASKNSTALSAGNTTMTSSMANATSQAQKQNNVTTAAGNNGHIYRGGAATGSGGE